MAEQKQPVFGEGPHAFLDIDINDSRAAYARAAEFVKENDLKYSFSSKEISELGGRELRTVSDYYNIDFEWSQKGPIRITPQPACRIIIELYEKVAPLAVQNFKALCTGEKGMAKGCSIPLHYRGSRFHRIVPGFVAQGGDFVFGNGTGGESIYGKKFKDERGGLRLRHSEEGVVSMGNSGKNSNGSQFFITLAAAPQCDGKHVVFGRVVSGMDVVRAMAQHGNADGGGEPSVSVVITECGLWSADMPVQGYWAPSGLFLPPPPPRDTLTAGCASLLVMVHKKPLGDKFVSALAASGASVTVTSSVEECGSALADGGGTGWAALLLPPGVGAEQRQALQKTAAAQGVPVKVTKPAAAAVAVADFLF